MTAVLVLQILDRGIFMLYDYFAEFNKIISLLTEIKSFLEVNFRYLLIAICFFGFLFFCFNFLNKRWLNL